MQEIIFEPQRIREILDLIPQPELGEEATITSLRWKFTGVITYGQPVNIELTQPEWLQLGVLMGLFSYSLVLEFGKRVLYLRKDKNEKDLSPFRSHLIPFL